MRPYHPNNLSLTPYAGWKVITLAWVAKFLGVQMHINGIPFGSSVPSFKRPDVGPRPDFDRNYRGDWVS